MAALNLPPGSSLSTENLVRAVSQAINRVDVKASPLSRKLVEIYARQNQYAIERAVLNEAKRWQALDARFNSSSAKLGLGPGEWRNVELLTRAYDKKDVAFKAGQLSRGEYRAINQVMTDIRSSILPVYEEMSRNPMYKSFIQRAWSSSAALSAQRLDASLEYYALHHDDKVLTAINTYYDLGALGLKTGGGHINKIVERIALDMKKDPSIDIDKYLLKFMKGNL